MHQRVVVMVVVVSGGGVSVGVYEVGSEGGGGTEDLPSGLFVYILMLFTDPNVMWLIQTDTKKHLFERWK